MKYRGISVITTMRKLYGRVLRNKLKKTIERKSGEEQAGFTAGRSCTDHIYTTHFQQLTKKKEPRIKELLAFVNLSKPYDTAPKSEFFKIIQICNCFNVTLTKAV